MTDRTDQPPPPTPPAPPGRDDLRRARLARALKANLARRKAQVRARAAVDAGPGADLAGAADEPPDRDR